MASSRGAAIVVPIVGDASRLSKGLTDAQQRIQNFGIAASAALAAFAYKSVQAYREREAAQNKLNIALSKSPALYNLTASALSEYNQALAEKTAVDDDVIAGAEAVLSRFAESEEQLKRLTELALDYSAATGQDLTSSATTVGKAMLGQTRALKALGVNYTATGDKALDAARILDLLSGKVSGTAEAFAQTTEGRFMEFQRQLGELQETIGAGLMPPLLALTNAATSLFEAVGKLPKPVQQVSFALLAAGAAAMALGPRILAAKAAMAQIEMQAVKSKSSVGLFTRAIGSSAVALPVVGAALAIGVTAFSLFSQSNNEAEQANKDFATQLDLTTGALNANNAALTVKTLQEQGAIDIASSLGVTQDELVRAVLKGGDAYDAVAAKLQVYLPAQSEANARGLSGARVMSEQGAEAKALLDKIGGLRSSVDQQSVSTERSTAAMKDNATTAEDNKAALDELSRSVQKLNDAWERFVGVSVDAREAELDRMRAGRDLIKLTKQDSYSQAELAEKIYTKLDAIEAEREANVKAGDSTRKATKFALDQAKALLDVAKAAGASKKEIDNLKLAIELLRQGGGAKIPVVVTSSTRVGQGDVARATGGLVLGRGTSTSDSIPAWLSNGEYVVQASAVAKYGVGFLNRLNAKRLASGGPVSGGSSSEARFEQLVDKMIGKLEKKLSEAVDHLKAVRGKMSELSDSVVDSTGMQLSSITASEGMRLSAQALRAGASAMATKARAFIAKLRQLAKVGLSRPLLSQIIGMGPDGGLEYATALLQGGKSLINDINRMERQTAKLAGKTGDYVARRYYGDDLKAAKRSRDRAADKLDAAREVKREIHVHVAGHVLTEKQLVRLIRDELKKDDKRNGRNG